MFHDDALVIEAVHDVALVIEAVILNFILNFRVQKVLIDDGSNMNPLPYSVFW